MDRRNKRERSERELPLVLCTVHLLYFLFGWYSSMNNAVFLLFILIIFFNFIILCDVCYISCVGFFSLTFSYIFLTIQGRCDYFRFGLIFIKKVTKLVFFLKKPKPNRFKPTSFGPVRLF
jgi:hypothetical protein